MTDRVSAKEKLRWSWPSLVAASIDSLGGKNFIVIVS